MSKVYANADGNIIRLLETDEQMRSIGAPPEFTGFIEFDEETNKNLVSDLKRNVLLFTMVNGILYQEGIPVIIHTAGNLFEDRMFIQNTVRPTLEEYITLMETGLSVYPTLPDFNAKAQFIVDNFQTLMNIIHGILVFIRWLIKWIKILD